MDTTFLQQLLRSPGPSSFEAKPSKVWQAQAEQYGGRVRQDSYGNAFATFGTGQKPRVMLTGHIDEIGLMVSYINPEGFIYFKTIGVWDSEQLVGQRVRLLSYRGKELLGVIAKKPVLQINQEDKRKISTIEDLWIDIGAKDQIVAKAHVRVGDVGVLEAPYTELLGGRIVSRALDNRISAYIVLEAARRAAEEKANADIVAVITVQEETTLLGAKTSAYGLEPEVAIVVDVTDVGDIPGSKKQDTGDVSLGTGPCLAVGSVVHQGVLKMLIQTAEEEGIPYTLQATPENTFTDAESMAATRSGIPTAVVSVPNRYMHSANEMVDLQDVEYIIRLLVAFTKKLTSETAFM
jgi:putative aminopeptidase FrvX